MKKIIVLFFLLITSLTTNAQSVKLSELKQETFFSFFAKTGNIDTTKETVLYHDKGKVKVGEVLIVKQIVDYNIDINYCEKLTYGAIHVQTTPIYETTHVLMDGKEMERMKVIQILTNEIIHQSKTFK